jgi:hypothetical protein
MLFSKRDHAIFALGGLAYSLYDKLGNRELAAGVLRAYVAKLEDVDTAMNGPLDLTALHDLVPLVTQKVIA